MAETEELLLTLEEFSRLVSNSHDPHQTLENIVRKIQQRFQSAVCSIYLLTHGQDDPSEKELVLAATVGLNEDSIGQIRMKTGEGLTGQVALRSEPLMVEDAFGHPDFKYFPDSGEDQYRSFLGIPLRDGGAMVGVLVAQTVETRTWSPSEIRMLTIIGAQVAPLVDDARMMSEAIALLQENAEGTNQDSALATRESPEQEIFEGISLSAGIGQGRAYVIDGFDEWRKSVPPNGNGVEVEKQRLERAMESASVELEDLSRHISELVGEDHGAILQAQLMIMQDHAIQRELTTFLENDASAEAALFQTLDKYVAAFQQVSSPFFQERVYDIKDVFHRLLWQLRSRPDTPDTGPEKVVLLAHEASVMELFAVDMERLAAVVVEHGSAQSHAAILARSLGIPMVGQVRRFQKLCQPGCFLHVDGSTGEVHIGKEAESSIHTSSHSSEHETTSVIELPLGMPRLEVNINLLHEVNQAIEEDASGIGLFRSEFLFLARRTLPTEEEQFDVYRKLLLRMQGRPVTIRTFDLRPDKLMAYSQFSADGARPFDWRLVLESPQLQQLFHDQIRAILRAGAPSSSDPNAIGQVRIVVPLVTHSELLDFVLQTLDRAREELKREELPYAEDVSLGLMIEVAAATTMLDLWAEHVDYFALGTNDLSASALGIDRDDTVAPGQSDSLHPGLLRIIHQVVESAHALNRPVTVCGELAADPQGCLALAALNIDALSVPVRQLQAVRRQLASTAHGSLRDLSEELLRQRTAKDVRQLLANESQ